MNVCGLNIFTKRSLERLCEEVENRTYKNSVADIVSILQTKDKIYLGGLILTAETYQKAENCVFIVTGNGPMISMRD